MKFLVLFGVLLVALLSEARFIGDSSSSSSSEESSEIAEAVICITSQGLLSYGETIGDIMTKDKYPVDDVKFNKFFGCYWKNKELIDEESNINQANLKKYLQNMFADNGKVTLMHQMFAQNIVDECKDTKGESYGQVAVKTQNCILAYLSQVADE